MSNRTTARPRKAASNGEATVTEMATPEPQKEAPSPPPPPPPPQQMQIPRLSADQAMMEILIEVRQKAHDDIMRLQVQTSTVLQELVDIATSALALSGKQSPQTAQLAQRLHAVKTRLVSTNV